MPDARLAGVDVGYRVKQSQVARLSAAMSNNSPDTIFTPIAEAAPWNRREGHGRSCRKRPFKLLFGNDGKVPDHDARTRRRKRLLLMGCAGADGGQSGRTGRRTGDEPRANWQLPDSYGTVATLSNINTCAACAFDRSARRFAALRLGLEDARSATNPAFTLCTVEPKK